MNNYIRNEIAKLVLNFGNYEQTTEPVRKKLCETLCNDLPTTVKEAKSLFIFTKSLRFYFSH